MRRSMMSRAFLAVFAAAFMSLVLAACKDKDDGPIPKKEGRRTVLIYQSAQNSLGYDSMHRKDSIELVAAKNSIGDDDRLLVFTDDGRTSARLYRYDHKHKTPQLVKHWSGETDASDPEFLQQLLTFVREKFPSKEYGLVMWSHADGWLPSTNKNYRHAPRRSFGIDVGTGGNLYHDQTADGEVGTQMDIADMARAIEHSGIHLRYIFFDACLMQSLEVAYELRNTTDYIVASPIATPADGAYYTHMLQRGLFSSDPTDIARTFYSDVCTDGSVSNSYGGYGLVVSCLKTEGLEELATLTSQMLSRSSLVGRTSPNMSDVQSYSSYIYKYFYRPYCFDARLAMQRLLPEADFEVWDAALARVLMYKAASSKFWIGPSNWEYLLVDTDNFCGVSMFVPQDVYTTNAERCAFGDHNENFKATSWYSAAGFAQTGW